MTSELFQSEPQQRRCAYGVVVIDALVLTYIALTGAIQWMARPGAELENHPTVLGMLACEVILATALAAGIIAELKLKRAALWLNIGWPTVMLFAAPLSMLAELAHEPTHRSIVIEGALTIAVPFLLILILYLFLYRVSFRPRVVTSETESVDAAQSQFTRPWALYAALIVMIYPIITLFLIRYRLTSDRSAAGLELLTFLTPLVAAVILAITLRAARRWQTLGVSISVIALILNTLLLIMIGFSA